MTVTVLLFASYADAVGRSSLELDVDEGATVRDVVDKVRALTGDNRLPPVPMVAVNERYATRESELRQGDEVALIPPVAGG
jgi:molybdopterin converting factor subunit 1